MVIVDSHHKVLTAWANYRKGLAKSSNKAPRLITLDHHTDTSEPFRNFLKNTPPDNSHQTQDLLLKSINFNNANSIQAAIKKLNNDEHIVAAIRSDIISSAFVLAHNAMDTDFNCYQKHKIVCREIKDNEYDKALESSVIDKAILGFNEILSSAGEDSCLEENYILDIDLDYFNTFKSVEPEDSVSFQRLAKNAGLITIATEPEYVASCAIDKGLNSEYLLEKLVGLI